MRRETLAEIVWAGSSQKDLRRFPNNVRALFGYSLFEMQQGLVPSSSHRPMSSIESGVYELREQDSRAWYRVLYFIRIKGKIVVLHCFEKDTRKTERNDLDTATRRLKEVLTALRETK